MFQLGGTWVIADQRCEDTDTQCRTGIGLVYHKYVGTGDKGHGRHGEQRDIEQGPLLPCPGRGAGAQCSLLMHREWVR